MSAFKRMRRAVSDWLKRLARENKRNFGGARPDCCSVNRQKPKAPRKEG